MDLKAALDRVLEHLNKAPNGSQSRETVKAINQLEDFRHLWFEDSRRVLWNIQKIHARVMCAEDPSCEGDYPELADLLKVIEDAEKLLKGELLRVPTIAERIDMFMDRCAQRNIMPVEEAWELLREARAALGEQS